MVITQLTIEQINTALLSLEQAGGNSNVDMTAINKLKADLEALKKKIGEGGIKPGQTYDINITGSATSATSANTAAQDDDGNTISTTYQKVNEKGQPNGYASLGVNGTVPIEQLPTELIVLKGFWNAETNTPHLQDGVGTSGDYYIVENGGTVDLGSGNITFHIGDGVIYANDNKWHRKADANLVQSVAGKVGVVELDVNDLTDNDILARKIIETNVEWDDVNWLGDGAMGGLLTDTYKAVVIDEPTLIIPFDAEQQPLVEGVNIINLQNWDGRAAVYISLPLPAVNTNLTTDDSGYHIEGAGLYLFIDKLSRKETVISIEMLYGNTAQVAIYWKDGYEERATFTSQAEYRTLSDVAKSGDYNDLKNVPPAAKKLVEEILESEYETITPDPDVLYAIPDAKLPTMDLSGLLKWKVLYKGTAEMPVVLPDKINELYIEVHTTYYSSELTLTIYCQDPLDFQATNKTLYSGYGSSTQSGTELGELRVTITKATKNLKVGYASAGNLVFSLPYSTLIIKYR